MGDRDKATLDAVLSFRGDSAALAERINTLERAVTGLTVEQDGGRGDSTPNQTYRPHGRVVKIAWAEVRRNVDE